MSADLHLHTTASDGRYSPGELVRAAFEKSFKTIAITDHDTTAGLKEGLTAAEKIGLELIPGIELSTIVEQREIHLLGYYLDENNIRLQETLKRLIEARRGRAVKMVEKLKTMGLDISLDRVREIAGSKFIGRPHIARAMQEKGYIKEIPQAFSTEYIGRGGKAYAERFKLTPGEGIELLHQAGAISVLAHPGYLTSGDPVSETEITALKTRGLRGIEVYYSRHTSAQQDYYEKIARRNNLLITGGSDCHGQPGAPNSLGTIRLPYTYVTALKQAAEKTKGKVILAQIDNNREVREC